MSLSDDKLNAITGQLRQGVVPPRESVRSFLRWFYAERRGFNVVTEIRQQLKKYGLTTQPDFEFAYIDGLISFAFASLGKDSSDVDMNTGIIDPTYRLGRLDSANRKPVSVAPNATLQQAITLMMTNDYSQLPVMTGVRDVKGVISWKSVGSRLALKRPCSTVQDCMEPPQIVSLDSSLFTAINLVAEYDYI